MDPIVFQNYDKTPKGEAVKNLGLTLELNIQSANQDTHPRVSKANTRAN